MSQSSYYPPPSTLLHPDKFPINNENEKYGNLLKYYGWRPLNGSWTANIRQDLIYIDGDDVSTGAATQSDYDNFKLCYLIPKLWVKYKKTNTGKMWLISNTPKPGYHLHPAFYNNKGQEVKEGILIWRHNLLQYPNTLNRIVHSYYYVGTSDCDYKTFSYKSAQEIVTEFNLVEYFGRLRSQVSQEEYEAAENDFFDRYPEYDAGWHLYNIYEDSLLSLVGQTAFADTPYSQSSDVLGLDYGDVYTTGMELRKSNDNEGQEIWSLCLLDPKSREMKNTGLRVGKELRNITLLTNQTEYYDDEYLQDIFLPKPSARDNYPILTLSPIATKPASSNTSAVADRYAQYDCGYIVHNHNNYFILKKKTSADTFLKLEDVDGKKAYAGYGMSYDNIETMFPYWICNCVDTDYTADVIYSCSSRFKGSSLRSTFFQRDDGNYFGSYMRLAKYI